MSFHNWSYFIVSENTGIGLESLKYFYLGISEKQKRQGSLLMLPREQIKLCV